MKEKIRKHKVWFIIGVVLVIGAATILALVTLKGEKASADGNVKKESTISLERMDLTTSISATGTIQSGKTKTVSAEVNGIRVKRVNVSVGDEVKKGDVLVTFDESSLQEILSDAKESLSDAESEADKTVSSAKKQLSEARENYSDEKSKLKKQVSSAKDELSEAKKQVSRLKNQVSAAKDADEKAKLQEQLTKAEETLKQAESGYETALNNQENTNKQNKNSVENAEDAVETAKLNWKKTLKEAGKQVDEAEENLEKCLVTAPISGVITASNVEDGDTYGGGDMFQIDNNSSYMVSTSVDEYDISDVSVGQKVIILTEATGDDEIEGEITFVAPSTGSTSLSSASSQSGESGGVSSTSSSGSYEVRIQVNTTDERLKMGLTARCSIILEEADNVYAVPYDAVHENRDGTAVVYIMETTGDSTSSKEIQVTKGMESDYYLEISGDELKEGLQIIIPTDETTSKDDDKTEDNSFGMVGGPGGMDGESGGGDRGSGDRGANGMRGSKDSGGMNGGQPGM